MRGRKTGGRVKGVPNKATRDIKALAQVHTPKALRTLVAIMGKSESDAARVAAANSLLDRGYGKPAQTIDATVRDERMVVNAPPPAKDADDWTTTHGPH